MKRNKKWKERDILSVNKNTEKNLDDYEIIYDKIESFSEKYSKDALVKDLEYVDEDYENYDIEESNKKLKSLRKVRKLIEDKTLKEIKFDSHHNYIIDYKNQLNREQLMAVICLDKPLLVIAGAGSGKTRVIIYKVAYLMESGIKPDKIVLLSFTRKASNEMLERSKKLLQNSYAEMVRGGTFHSFANATLRKYGAILGISSSFTIIDIKDSEDIIDLQKQELEIQIQHKNGIKFPSKGIIQKIISRSCNTELSIQDTILNYFESFDGFIEEIEKIKEAFQGYKKSKNLMDYDDLLNEFRNGLKNNIQFRSIVQKSIDYVLVDEYQDTNNAQREIVELIVGNRTCVTVVGDDAQSIYGFRGSNYENILRFPESFKDFACIKIEENYRSGQEILNFTNDILNSSKINLKKNLRSNNSTGKLPIIKRFEDINQESEFIANKILEIKKENNLKYKDFAILNRFSWVSGYSQTALLKNNIPFIVVGGVKFNEKRHIRDMIAFLRIAVNPIDEISWHRILQILDGVGKIRSSEIVGDIISNNGVIDFRNFQNKIFYKSIHEYEKLYKSLKNQDITPEKMIQKFIPLYSNHLQRIEDDFNNRIKDLDILKNIAKTYPSIKDFLSSFVLEPPSDKFNENTTPYIESGDSNDYVVVSTIHSAKGLEWHTVFLPVLLDGILPSDRSLYSIEELEEERRLFYVASSRVKNNLFITMPEYVSSWDKIYSRPSRFLKQINKNRYIL